MLQPQKVASLARGVCGIPGNSRRCTVALRPWFEYIAAVRRAVLIGIAESAVPAKMRTRVVAAS